MNIPTILPSTFKASSSRIVSNSLCISVVVNLTVLLPAVLGWYVAQQQIPAVEFVHKYDPVFSLK